MPPFQRPYNNTTIINKMSDDEYEIPLQDKRVFGAGIKRKRVKFVPSTAPSTSLLSSKSSGQSVSDLYLKMVLPGDHQPMSSANPPSEQLNPNTDELPQTCEICKLPLFSTPGASDVPNGSTKEPDHTSRLRPHEASLAHQVCLAHSHPPSHLDRNRKGLSYLSAYGWDPDARVGLGASGQGIQYPIKTKPKDDKMGIGVVLPKGGDRRKKEKVVKLDAGKVRKLYEKDQKKAARLREMFYQNDDVTRYLGGG